jgi:hypothetical protein
MYWVWIILAFAIVTFVILRVRQVRAHNERGAGHDPFIEFVTDATNTMQTIAPTTWRSSQDNSWNDRNHAIEVLDELIRRGDSINTPKKQQVYQTAYLTLLSSLRDEWLGYPYEGAQGEIELASAREHSQKCLRFFISIQDAVYPKRPPRSNWENYVFGPKGDV